MHDENKKLFSIVVPVYGNEKNIPITIPYFIDNLSLFPNYDVEIILVCDGSPDNSFEEMKKVHALYPGVVKIVSFTRNFGQGAAIHCGLDLAKGDVIGVISCDMQDPFELFAEMLAAWEDGYKLVIASRKDRKDGGVGAESSKLLHRIIHRFIDTRYPKGGFDFFLLDRDVARQFCEIDAANGYTQMVLIWLGYKYKNIEYVREKRTQGKSGYKFWRKLTIVISLFTTYTTFLSQIWAFVGAAFAGIGFVAFLITLILSLCGHSVATGLILSFIALCTGVLLCATSALGEYIWRIFDNSKHRPRYVIDEIHQ